MKLRILRNLDYILMFSVIALVFIGVMFIYSSGINSTGVQVSMEYTRQIAFGSTGLVLMVLMTIIDYRKFKQMSPVLYGILLVLLIYTRIFGDEVNGAKSWLGIGSFGIQPSEFGKLIFAMFLARYLEDSANENELKRFIKACIIMALPMGLILIQPDMGTASVYVPIFLIMCYAAGVPKRYLGLLLSIGILTIVMTILPIWESDIYRKAVPVLKIFRDMKLRLTLIIAFALIAAVSCAGYIFIKEKYFYWITYAFGVFTFSLGASILGSKVLKPYQIMRLIVFLNPEVDPRGSGWHIIQSKIAIGSGNFWGQGFLQGTQSHYRYLPTQSTDFIFSILSEELGFFGGLLVFALFTLIFIRGLVIVRNTTNVYGYYISLGIVFMIFYHFIVNIGMAMGIMPITGIPLLFLSYGGSALWMAMCGIGILMSINLRRTDYK
ncbi:MAG: rod shape-determining protein RodA [Treponemataceae bacterium]|nr:rod shape-determining protein RodA [Treponemataceae bacterium]